MAAQAVKSQELSADAFRGFWPRGWSKSPLLTSSAAAKRRIISALPPNP